MTLLPEELGLAPGLLAAAPGPLPLPLQHQCGVGGSEPVHRESRGRQRANREGIDTLPSCILGSQAGLWLDPEGSLAHPLPDTYPSPQGKSLYGPLTFEGTLVHSLNSPCWIFHSCPTSRIPQV